MPSPPNSAKSTRVDDLLAHASSALVVANDFGSVLPIPLVASLIGSAQVIIQTAQSVRQSRLNCAELASRVSKLALMIREQVHGKDEPMDPRLRNALEGLEKVFQRIEQFVLQQDQVSLFQRIARRTSIEADVRKFTGDLDFAMRMFQTGSQIRTELQLAEVMSFGGVQTQKLVAIDERGHHERKYHEGGEFRVYRPCDIHLIQPITFQPLIFESDAINSVQWSVPIGEYFKAEVKGRAAIVVRKPIKVALTLLGDHRMCGIADLSVLKQSFHPNVAQLEGYSYGTANQFYVIKGRLTPMSVHLGPLSFLERGLQTLRALVGIDLGYAYLRRFGVSTSVTKEHVMVDSQSQNTIIGVDGEFRPSSGIGNSRHFNMHRWSDQLQHDFLDTFANGGAMTYREAIRLWSGFSGSVYINTSRIRCNPPPNVSKPDDRGSSSSSSVVTVDARRHSLYTRPGIVMACPSRASGRRRFTQCDFVEYIDEERTKPVDVLWPPALHKRDFGEPYCSYWEDPEEAVPCGTTIETGGHDVWFETSTAARYLLEHALSISKKIGVDMCDVYTVHHQNFTFIAQHSPSCAHRCHPPIYLHVSPKLEDDCEWDAHTNSIPTPWAYFSFSPEPTEDEDERLSLMQRDDIRGTWRTDYHKSTLPGVEAYVWVTVDYNHFDFTNLQAEFASFLYTVFHPLEDGEEIAKGRIVELMETRLSS